MERKKKLLLNSLTGIILQVITIICSLILPRNMLLFFGSSINGLVSSIAHFLSFISLLEMGIGPVIQANLYKPLAEHDNEQISRIFKSSQKFFSIIGIILVIYTFLLVLLFPHVIDKSFDYQFTTSLIIIIAINLLVEYFIGIKYQLLLNADQKAYIHQFLGIITTIANTAVCVFLMHRGFSIHIIKGVSTGILIIKPFLLMVYVNKRYDINRKICIHEEPIKQKWNGFSQHLAGVVSVNIDVVLLTFFSTLDQVSIYNTYFMVTNGITALIMTAASGLEALMGNMIAKRENSLLETAFTYIEWGIHLIVTVLFTVAAITICPFVMIYTRQISDANYNVPLFGYLIVFAYAMQCLRIPYFRLIKAAGKFKETQNGAYISTIINICISLIFVSKFGIVGVAVGTFSAMAFHTLYLVAYNRKHLLCRPMKNFLIHFIVDIICIVTSILLSRFISISANSYYDWIVYALYVSILTLIVVGIMNITVFRKDFNRLLLEFKKIISH